MHCITDDKTAHFSHYLVYISTDQIIVIYYGISILEIPFPSVGYGMPVSVVDGCCCFFFHSEFRKLARQLENELDLKLVSFSKLCTSYSSSSSSSKQDQWTEGSRWGRAMILADFACTIWSIWLRLHPNKILACVVLGSVWNLLFYCRCCF